MPSEYIVEARKQAEQWSNDRGTFQAWEVKLMDGAGSYFARTNTKLGKEFPAVGDKVDGDLIPDGPDRYRFKRSYGGGGGGGNGYKRDPKESASIVRQHSQQMAIMWVAILQKNPQTAPTKLDYEYLKGVIDWFAQDAGGQ